MNYKLVDRNFSQFWINSSYCHSYVEKVVLKKKKVLPFGLKNGIVAKIKVNDKTEEYN